MRNLDENSSTRRCYGLLSRRAESQIFLDGILRYFRNIVLQKGTANSNNLKDVKLTLLIYKVCIYIYVCVFIIVHVCVSTDAYPVFQRGWQKFISHHIFHLFNCNYLENYWGPKCKAPKTWCLLMSASFFLPYTKALLHVRVLNYRKQGV